MNERVLLTADPRANFEAHAEEIRAAIDRVLRSDRYILGPEVSTFEAEFASYLAGGHVVGVANGTDALELALRAVGVGPGDRVATVANTVSATAAAIEQIGAHPVFVEVDAGTMLMSPAGLTTAFAREPRIRVVVPVHLYGCPADMPEIVERARGHGARVVEDCAQAHGAAVAGRKVGTWGDAAAFSFYPTKNLGAIGDGGAVFTPDAEVANRVRLLRQYGWRTRYVSDLPGRNSRLDELQAAILRVKLQHLEAENECRRKLAARYLERLGRGPGASSTRPVRLPEPAAHTSPVWHQYVIRTRERDALRAHLASQDIHAGVLYPVPLHRQPAYAVPELMLPQTERACAEVLSLPLHPGLTAADIDRVSAEILRWAKA